ncbi:hypothetical protein ED352_02120 [Muribaculaceae bacterium Isolate-002 (NCI)]|nr:hypothetical protein ED352_02120 [Muribaculaceae bacterium Isolate-002 (NCI)]
MSVNFEQRLNEINAKTRMLTQRYQYVVMQRNEALERLSQVSGELAAARQRIEELTRQVDYLRMASAIEAVDGDIEQSRRFLSELVWEIDKCISQLSE